MSYAASQIGCARGCAIPPAFVSRLHVSRREQLFGHHLFSIWTPDQVLISPPKEAMRHAAGSPRCLQLRDACIRAMPSTCCCGLMAAAASRHFGPWCSNRKQVVSKIARLFKNRKMLGLSGHRRLLSCAAIEGIADCSAARAAAAIKGITGSATGSARQCSTVARSWRCDVYENRELRK